MVWSIAIVSCAFLSSTLALTIPPTQDLTNLEPLPSATNKTLPELTSLTLDVPALISNSWLDALVPVCKGDLLGFDMNRYSCQQAWSTIPISYNTVSFGDREGSYNVQLPRRFSGPDCTCVIDIFHKDGAVSDEASWRDISKAAELLYGTCVSSRQRRQGGYISDIGFSRNLVVVLSIYKPSVACFLKPLAISDIALQSILSLLPVSTDRQIFGPEGEPGVQVVLPFVRDVPSSAAPSSQGMRLKVDVGHRNTVTARWVDVWAGAVAVGAMCASRGKTGISGLPSGLEVSLDAIPRPSGHGNRTFASREMILG